jgi:hypothetical protein
MMFGGLVTGRRMARLRRALSSNGDTAFRSARDQATSTVLVRAYGFRVGVTLGIVFLMTVQPDFMPAAIALVSAALVGVLATSPVTTHGRAVPPQDARTV